MGEVCDDFQHKHAGAHVFDPTRWVFEHVKPYIFLGEDRERSYDVSGDRLSRALVRLYPTNPVFGDVSDVRQMVVIKLDDLSHLLKLGSLIMEHGGPMYPPKDGAIELPTRGLRWLGNLPVSMLGMDTARALYEALYKIGQSAIIPIDNYETVMGDGFYGYKKALEKRIKGKAKK